VLLQRRQGGQHQVRPAGLLQPGRDLGVIQVWVIAAVTADELKRGGKAAFRSALHDARRLGPQGHLTAVAGLTSRREVVEALIVAARPRVTGMARSACHRNDTLTIG
jgi:hypothetical protein